jgi:hypothetical protein
MDPSGTRGTSHAAGSVIKHVLTFFLDGLVYLSGITPFHGYFITLALL